MNYQVITSPQRFSGQVRYTGQLTGTVKWRTGAITLTKLDTGWNLKMTYDCNNYSNPNHSVLNMNLTSRTLQKVVCKDTAFIDVRTSRELITVFFKGTRKGDVNTLKHIFEDAQCSPTVHAAKSEVGANRPSQISPANKTPFSTASTHKENGQTVNGRTSPQRFTSVKENRRQDRKTTFLDDSDDDSKENHVTPLKPADKFLQRSGDKSRQCLGTLGSSFYGAATPKSFYNSTPTLSSQWLNSKRGPGLMPDPTPIKRPRLSDSIPYSMKAKSTTSTDQKQQPTLQGFSNLGNTCYMNAILQSLFGLETLTTDLISTNRRLLKTLSPQSLYSALVKLLCSRRQNASDLSRRDYLRRVKTAISNTAKRFSGYGQHDAHEFLGQVLDQLKDEVIVINKSTPSPPRETTNTVDEFVSPTSRNFEFEVLHTISCEQCREEVTNTEQFHDVSVDLPKRRDVFSPRSLQDALSIFFREEQIEYTCEKCGHNKSTVTHKFVRLPRVFILHLKRYSYNQMFSRNTKVGQNVSIPLYMTLDPHCDEDTQPAFPVPMHDVCSSEQKSVMLLDDSREETPSRRKLDYPGFKFKKTASVATATDSETAADLASPSKDSVDVKKSPSDARPTLTLEDEGEDVALNRAIEMSLQAHEDQERRLRDYGEDNDGNLERALEMSRSDGPSHDTAVVAKDIKDLSEEEMIQLAIEESLRETDTHHHGNDTQTDDVTDTCAQDYSHYNGVADRTEHTYSTSYDIGPDVVDCRNVIKGSQANSDDIIKCCSDVVMSSNNVVMSSTNAVMSSNDDVMSSDDVLSSSLDSTTEDTVKTIATEQLTKIEDKNTCTSVGLRKFARNSYFDRLANAKFSSDDEESSGNVSNSTVTTVKQLSKTQTGIHSDSDSNSSPVTDVCDFDAKCEPINSANDLDSVESSDALSLIPTDDESDNCEKCERKSIGNSAQKVTRSLPNSTLVKQEFNHVTDKSIKDSQRDLFGSDSEDVEMNEDCQILTQGKVDENMNEIIDCDQITNDDKYNQVGQNHKQNDNLIVNENVVKETGDEAMVDSGINSDCEIVAESGDNVKTPMNAGEKRKLWRSSGSETCDNGKSCSSSSEHCTTSLSDNHVTNNIQRKCQLTNITNGEEVKSTEPGVVDEVNDTEGQTKVIEGHSKVTVQCQVEEFPQFNCDEDDSWMFSIDEKENKLPSRPTLSDPSDLGYHGNGVATDEVDGFIEENLNIPEIKNEKGELPYSYRLVSVVNHMGVSSSTGHYISDVYDVKKRTWNSFDDAHVSKMAESDVISTRERTGYIFFYLSKDLFDDLCLQHSISTKVSSKLS